jgi:Ca2+-binding RTX toxin-like protein
MLEDDNGHDELFGGGAGDAVTLGNGQDVVHLGPGNDGLYVGLDAETDVVFCGPGYDRVWTGPHLDPRDRFHDCEEFSDHP